MFSIVKLEDTVKLNPDQFNNINESIKQNLRDKYENKIVGKIDSLLMKIIDIDEKTIKSGKINDVTSSVNYLVKYTSIAFSPIKGQILDVIVTKCNEIGLFCKVKLLQKTNSHDIVDCICPKDIMVMDKFTYNSKENCWTKDNHNLTVKLDDTIRMKILDFNVDYNKIVIIGTI